MTEETHQPTYEQLQMALEDVTQGRAIAMAQRQEAHNQVIDIGVQLNRLTKTAQGLQAQLQAALAESAELKKQLESCADQQEEVTPINHLKR